MNVLGTFTHKYNPKPRLSANQVGEYLYANAIARRRILTEAKFPPTIITTRYEMARKPIAAHLSSKDRSPRILTDALTRLERREAERRDGWAGQNYSLCIAAIQAFMQNEERFGLRRYNCSAPEFASTRIRTSGVVISVSLDLVVTRRNGNNQNSFGGVCLVLSKSGGAEEKLAKRCEAIALLVRQFMDANVQDAEVDPGMCMAVDVFGGKVYRAKRQQKMLERTISSSCEEIVAQWPSIKPPPKYSGPPIIAA